MPTRNLIVLSIALVIAVVAHASGDRSPHGRRLGEIIAAVERSYIEKVDGETLFEAAVQGVMSKLDENSRYVSGEERAEFEASLDLEFCGVGLELADGESGIGEAGPRRYLEVDGLLPGSPAWKAGLAAGDSILAIDGISTRGMTTSQAVTRLRGRPGSRVVVTVAGSGTDAAGTVVRDVELVRETIRIESVLGDRRRDDGTWEWRIDGRPEIAFIRLASFGEHTRDDLERAVEQTLAAGRPAGLVLDLRGNPGGLVTSAVEVADLFLDSRELIVATRGRPSTARPATDRRLASAGDILDGVPMAVLVDGETASAAEIVAAALQDHARAKVFGGRTFGKGTVQQILPLSSDGGLLKITSSEYLRPTGKSIERSQADAGESWGVLPDVGLEISIDRDEKRRLTAWRRHRDLVRPRSGPAAGPSGEVPSDAVALDAVSGAVSASLVSSMADAPERVDPVLGRAVEWLTALPEPRMPEKNSPPRR